MNDRWRLKNKVDPQIIATVPYIVKDVYSGKVIGEYKELTFFRKSHLEEMKEKYGDDLEVMCYGRF